MTILKSPLLLLPAFLLLVSCNKDPEQKGCTDPFALNYEPRALKDDGTCEFNQNEQVIWHDGVFGGWNSNVHEGAYRLDICEGIAEEMASISADSTSLTTLYLGTGGAMHHHSLFTLINERDGRDFAEGSLRFNARLSHASGSAPEFIQLFVSGKIPEGECKPYNRSTFVEISTRSFTDSTFSEVIIPLRHFSQLMMSRIIVVAGFDFEADRNMGIEIDQLRWVANAVE